MLPSARTTGTPSFNLRKCCRAAPRVTTLLRRILRISQLKLFPVAKKERVLGRCSISLFFTSRPSPISVAFPPPSPVPTPCAPTPALHRALGVSVARAAPPVALGPGAELWLPAPLRADLPGRPGLSACLLLPLRSATQELLAPPSGIF